MDSLLAADALRVDVDGVPCVDGLTLRTTGSRVVVLGAGRGLFEAVSGTRRVARGALRVAGADPLVAVREAIVAGAPLDPPLPPEWTPRDYVTWSARLVGLSPRDARTRAAVTLDALKMSAISSAPLRTCPLHLRRATVAAAAMATGASTIVLEDPTAGLSGAAGHHFSRALCQALAERSWLLFCARMPLASPFGMHADEAIVLTDSTVAAQGALGELASREKSYALRVAGRADHFAEKAEARGVRVVRYGAHLMVDLGASLRTRDLFDAADESSSVIVELRSLARAFA